MFSPISGRVDTTNDELAAKPELINSDPYGEGWLVILTPSNLDDDLRALLSADDYFTLMVQKLQTEHEKLDSR